MSYYSKVAYIFRAKDEPDLVQAMRQWDAEHPESYEKAFDLFSHADEKTISSDGKYLLVYWNYLKWYYESNDVAFFVERLPNMDERTKTMNSPNAILLERLKDERDQSYSNGIYHWSQLNFAYNSNHMEGNSLTPFQTQTLFDRDSLITENNQSVKVNDIIETRNHFQGFDFILDNCKEPLSEDMIKELHRILQSGTSNDIKLRFNIGEYKRIPNIIGGIEEIETCPPEKVKEEMHNLLDRYLSIKHPTFTNG